MRITTIIIGLLFATIFYLGLAANNVETDSGLIFSHKYHVEDEELECLDCHENVIESITGVDNLLPSKEVCADCHDVEEEDQNCADCHTNPDDPKGSALVVNDDINFSHKKHYDEGKECEDCHEGIAEKETVLPYLIPDMVACMDCHETDNPSSQCMTCHTSEEDLLPLSHLPNFAHSHGDLAQADAMEFSNDMSCQTCHSVDYCQTCHEGDNLDRFSHPLNYIVTHSLESRGKQKDCQSCHFEKQFCNDCHRDFNILPHNHVAGWTNTIPGDGGWHRIEAQNDLENCRSCHDADAEVVCSPCHLTLN